MVMQVGHPVFAPHWGSLGLTRAGIPLQGTNFRPRLPADFHEVPRNSLPLQQSCQIWSELGQETPL